MRWLAGALVVAGVALVTAQCGGTVTTIESSGDASRACVPGASVPCAGGGGCTGFQVCNAAGTALGACQCTVPGSLPGDDAPPPDLDSSSLGYPGYPGDDGGPFALVDAAGASEAAASVDGQGPGGLTNPCTPGARACAGDYPAGCVGGVWQVGTTRCFAGCYAGLCQQSGVCLTTCTADVDCASTCPAAPPGSANCCDLTAATCYRSGTSACPVQQVGAE